MLKNFFRTAVRAFLKSRTSATINILGLAIGIATCTLIFIYVKKETGYDKFHAEYENIFRFYTVDKALGINNNSVGITMPRLPAAAKEEIPEVMETTRMINEGRVRIDMDDRYVYAENSKVVEAPFFKIFNFKLLNPEALEAFEQPNKAFLTQSMAKKMFGDENPIGQTFKADENDWEVIGLVEDVNKDSHLKIDVLMSMYPTELDSSGAQYLNSFNSLGMIGYALLDKPASKNTVEEKMLELVQRNEAPEYWIPQLQSLKDVHLGSSGIIFDAHNVGKGDITYVYALSSVALFIILIAGFNFMNLSTAQSSARSKEVGVRKVMGAFRYNLILQHLSESVLICLIAALFSFILVEFASYFIDLGIEGGLLTYIFSHPDIYLSIFAGTFFIGILSGLYPALVISKFDPIKILRGQFQASKDGILLRKVLVVLQFAISIAMIIGTVLIFKQLDYIKNKDLGFSKDQVVSIQINEPGIGTRMATFRDKLTEYDNIEMVAMSTNMPGRTFGRTGVRPEGTSQEGDPSWIASVFSIDHNYLDLMKMELASGRNFMLESGTDQQESILVNEAFVNQIGWEDPIGKTLNFGTQSRRIIGVVKNFHYSSMRQSIEPLLLFYNPNITSNLSFLVKGDIKTTMASVEQEWNEVFAEYPFNYQFFDEEFGQMFQADEAFSKLISSFTWLAIFIACLGLFGLSAYIAEQRKKEIGVRRVLGSTMSQIVLLLSKEFMILIIIATALAWPIAYYAMTQWLSDFQYRINILDFGNLFVFAISGIVALSIGLLTVLYQSFVAAMANPVNSLRSE
ncbi:MAG TPA: ABC transporter permease [Saprospiraceae bacterium]|nr:ABC transporter permease [Saprospiraceae bacterium]